MSEGLNHQTLMKGKRISKRRGDKERKRKRKEGREKKEESGMG